MLVEFKDKADQERFLEVQDRLGRKAGRGVTDAETIKFLTKAGMFYLDVEDAQKANFS